MRLVRGHPGRIRALAYSPDGSKIATAGDSGVTKLWDAATWRELATIRQPEADTTSSTFHKRVRYLAFSPDGKLLATATLRVRLWDVGTASEAPFPEVLRESCPPMAFAPNDGSLIVVWGSWELGQRPGFDNSLLAWSGATGQIEHPLLQALGDGERVEKLAVSASADLLAVACRRDFQGCVRLWSLTGKQVRGRLDMPLLEGHQIAAAVQEMAFSPDGRLLAVAEGQQAAVFELPGGRLRGKVEANHHQLTSVAFAPDGRLFATASLDGTVRLWDADSLGQRAAYNWKLGSMRGVRFHPDGMTAAAFGDRVAVVIWDVDGV
jgi:WD40 repeat protein